MNYTMFAQPKSVVAIVCVFFAAWSVDAADDSVDFGRDVLPILSDTCFQCHGPDPKEGRKGDLRLDDETDVKRDREGYHVVLPGKSAASELLKRIISTDSEEKMPPPDLGRSLSTDQIDILRRWIDEGAKWGKNWAFEKVQRPSISKAEEETNPVDVFVNRTLKEGGIAPNESAPKESLIRRLMIDLTGLPPTPKQIDAFLADNKPGAWERLVDRVLNSPAYGERMAWDWLEAARYSDSNGYQGDRERTMWPWRDWVVRAFNKNLPWDEFTIQQLAGDLLPDATDEQILATGFNRNHMINGEGGRIAEENRIDYIFDMTETVGTVWLGLTLNCCRCHDHKFDPVTQREYFALTAFFNQTPVSGAGGNAQTPPLLSVPSLEQSRREIELKVVHDGVLKRQTELAKKLNSGQRDWELNRAGVTQWTPLTAESAKASNQRLTILGDQSVLASGQIPDHDTYVITSSKVVGTTRAIRLEALQHKTLANGGKGLSRAPSGNFVLTEFEILANGKPVRIKSAMASFEQRGFTIKKAFDGSSASGWAVFEGQGVVRPHEAIFILKTPIPKNSKIEITLHQDGRDVGHVMGRFRISTSSDGEPRGAKNDALFLAALRKDPPKRSAKESQLIGAAYRNSIPEYRRIRDELASAKKPLDALRAGIPKVMVMGERAEFRKTYILDRGLYNQPGKEVKAGIPSSLPALKIEGNPTRLDLARWLVSRDQPLTSRVTVNRFWQMLFGIGLVKTPEDFGVQGEYPVQRELLDWLAAEFIESGWDVKKLLRTIVTSDTWKRSSVIKSPTDFEADPENRLLARGSRYRMPSWMLRDQALAVSGQLNQIVGGAPVHPYQPKGIWAEATFGNKKYQQDSGDALYRRSLYTFWRRIVGPPVFFDSAKRQVCEVKPLRTNTPMHALTTLNDVTYVESARALAAEILREEKEDTKRFALAGLRVLGRPPTAPEMVIWQRSLDRATKTFSADTDSARDFVSLGDSKPDAQLPPVAHAAWTALCLNLLNLDETLNRE